MRKFPYLIILFTVAAFIGISCGSAKKQASTPDRETPLPDTDTMEPLHSEIVVFMMARCPHCADLMKTLLPLDRKLGDRVQITFGFVGSVDEEGKADLLHGDAEVASASLAICAGMVAPRSNWMGFMECIYKDDTWRGLPSGWEKCAADADIDETLVNQCIESGDGADQLGISITTAAAEGIMGAPTVFINGKRYIGPRDGESLATYLCHMTGSEETLPAACKDVPIPEKLSGVLVLDKRCEELEECDIQRELEYLKTLLPTLEVEEIDYSQKSGRRLYDDVQEQNGPSTVPFLAINNDLSGYPIIKAHLSDYLLPTDDGYIMPLGMGFDPTKEICTNQIDDNGNGKVDCDDEDCAGTMACREVVNGKLDLFIMSQCPFAAMIVPAVDHFLKHMETDREQVDFSFQFIGTIEEDGLDSMHGPSEVAEDLRMICVQHLYPKNYQFMEYMMCRAKRYHSDDWEECVAKGMSKKKIQACAEGDTGRELLEKSFALSATTKNLASPSWMLNNQKEIEARRSTEIFEEFCKENKSPRCAEKIKPLLIDKSLKAPVEKCQ